TDRVLADIPACDGGFQAACSRRKFVEKEIAIRLGVTEHGLNLARELRYSDFSLHSRCSHPPLVPRIGSRSGAFKEGIPDEIEIASLSCCRKGPVCGLTVAGPRLSIHEVLDRGLHPGCECQCGLGETPFTGKTGEDGASRHGSGLTHKSSGEQK